MQSEQLNGHESADPERKVRISLKVSESLAQEVLGAYQEILEKEENPPFKEQWIGDYFEGCINAAAVSILEESDAKTEVEQVQAQLKGQQDQGRSLKIWLYVVVGFAVIMAILATIFYRKYKAYV